MMTEYEILAIWNGPTSVCNRAKVIQFAADLASRMAEQDKEMERGFGEALAITESVVDQMSESLEQRIDLIAEEVDRLPMHSRTQWTHEFARRLLAEQQKREPFAWVIPGDDNANDNGFLDAMCYQHGEFTKPLYAVPPQDAQDGMVTVPREPTDAMYNAGLNYLKSKGTAWYVNDLYRAMLDAAMRGNGEGT